MSFFRIRHREQSSAKTHVGLCTAVVLVATLFMVPKTTAAQSLTCESPGTKANKLRQLVIAYVMDTGYARLRTNLGVTARDTSHLTIVTADSICSAVTAASMVGSPLPARTRAMIVVRFQDFYAAVTPEAEDPRIFAVMIFTTKLKPVASIQ